MKIKYNPRIIRHLGTELITTDEIAVTELVKNSYDAKAKNVRIQFLSSLEFLDEKTLLSDLRKEIKEEIGKVNGDKLLLIEDNGIGMSIVTLMEVFFEIGSSYKFDQKRNPDNNQEDVILGDKGIGRLSAQRLGPIMFVETTTNDEKNINLIKIVWDDLINDKNSESLDLFFEKAQPISYTRLWFLGTEDQPLLFENLIVKKKLYQRDIFGNPSTELIESYFLKDDLQSSLSFLYSPFETNKSLLDISALYDGRVVKLDFNYDTLKIAESTYSFESSYVKGEDESITDLQISMKMDIKPWFIERVHQVELGKVLFQGLKRSHVEYDKLLKKYAEKFKNSLSEQILLSDLLNKWNFESDILLNLLKISPIEGKIYSFKRDNTLIRIAVNSALDNGFIEPKANINSDIKSFLEANNGIKLYRNNFRIGTIGNKDDDWLKLQQKRTSGQQFYRFELGNVIGFIKINDSQQKYIYETSSRQHLTDNPYVKALQTILEYVFEAFSPRFTKRAVDLTKDILDAEGMIPKNTPEEIKGEVKKSNDLLKSAEANINAIQKAFVVINENIELDSAEKVSAIKNILLGLNDVSINFEQNISDAKKSFQSANKLIQIAESEQKRIEIEAYNNYKLMANGLVTEVITHELHSLLSNNIVPEESEQHFTRLKEYLFETKMFELNKIHLTPIKKKFDSLFAKMNDLNRFYLFLEKTFLYKGNSQDFERVNVKDYLNELKSRFDFRLQKNKIEFRFDTVSQFWVVPKGSLMHVFYNLIDNSIYWIQERQRRAQYDLSYKVESEDFIVVNYINDTTIQFYDSGTGILNNYEHTLFNSMESGKDNGRGMGLYIVKNFLRSFGGEIELLENRNQFDHRYIFEIRVKNNDLG